MTASPLEFRENAAEAAKVARLVLGVRLLAVLAAFLCLLAGWPWGPVGQVTGGVAALALLAFAFLYRGGQGSGDRLLRIQANAVEISKGHFTRFVLFDEVKLLRVQRRKDDSITAVVLVTQEGPLVVRGFEEMELIFGHLSTRKPEAALIQIEPAAWWQ